MYGFNYLPSLLIDLRSYDPLRMDGTLPLGKPCTSTILSCMYI